MLRSVSLVPHKVKLCNYFAPSTVKLTVSLIPGNKHFRLKPNSAIYLQDYNHTAFYYLTMFDYTCFN